MGTSRRRDGSPSSSSESDSPRRKSLSPRRSDRTIRPRGDDADLHDTKHEHTTRQNARHSRVSPDHERSRRDRNRHRDHEDDDSEGRRRGRRSKEDRHSSPRRGDQDSGEGRQRAKEKDSRKVEALPPPPPPPPPMHRHSSSSDDDSEGHRRERRYRENRHSSPRRGDQDSGEARQRGKEKDLKRKVEALPHRHSSSSDDDSKGHRRERRSKDDGHSSPPQRRGEKDSRSREALPPPPPPLPIHRDRRDARSSSSGEDDNSEGPRRALKRNGEDSSPRRRGKEKDSRREEALPPPPPLPPKQRESRRDERCRERLSSDEDGDSEGRGRGRRSREERHRRHHTRGDRDKDRDTRKEETLPPPPPMPPMPDAMAGRTGGIYIPPFRMAQMMREVEDKSSDAYQRLSWDALRKSINGLVNKVNATNIKNIIPELLSENLIRGRGLFCRSCMKSQMASPGFTDVFAALVAVVNTRFPDIGKLLLKRIVWQLQRAYSRNDKPQLLAATKFIAHLVNQQVAHEIIALELLTLLLENPTDDSVEVAVGFVKECGAILQDLSPQGLYGIFERFRGILHEAELDKRVRYLIEDLFGIRRAKFEGYPAVRQELDLVEQEDQYIHEISLEDKDIDRETNLDVFKPNPQFMEDEKAYEDLKKNILGAESSEDESSDEASDDDDEEESEEDEDEKMEIKDETETNLVNLRRTIYLTIMSSVDFEEAGHKLLKIKLEPGQEMELCIMLLECCSQERTYLRYYGLLGQRFCMINKVHQENFETCFVQQYSMIHRLETNKLRNVAKFFAHLLGTSALPWHVLAYIRLTEEDTTSSSRIFIKILFQELSEHLGIKLLNERLNDPMMQDSFEAIFPKDNPKNTRFSINFFTSIGLGGITESLREYLKNMPRLIMQQQKPVSDSDGSSSGSESESDSESESSSDESERNRSRKKRKK